MWYTGSQKRTAFDIVMISSWYYHGTATCLDGMAVARPAVAFLHFMALLGEGADMKPQNTDPRQYHDNRASAMALLWGCHGSCHEGPFQCHGIAMARHEYLLLWV